MTIENFKLFDFLHKPDDLQVEYTKLLMCINPVDTKRALMDLKLKQVERIKLSKLSDMELIIKTISKLQRTDINSVLEMRITDFFPLLVSLKNELEVLVRAESQLVPSVPNLKWEIVNGSKRIAKFGIYNTLIPLSKQLGVTMKEVNNMKYSEVFTVLYSNKVNQDLQREMNEIKLDI